MSGTLYAKIKPKRDNWKWHFKYPLRDAIASRGELTSNDIGFLQGLTFATTDDKDREDLQEMIDALNEGNTIITKVEY